MLRRFVVFAFVMNVLAINGVMANADPFEKSRCHIVYDAGSSGTRLYIYQYVANQWIEHAGVKVSALADPVSGHRGKTFGDILPVIDEVIGALDSILKDGPMKNGKAKWQAFDWEVHCNLASAQVLATAGMRIAEYENHSASEMLWHDLAQKLQERVGDSVVVDTHTLTGFEEGLFAWLAVKEELGHDDFGIVEMGGASSQVTFPCPNCTNINNATRSVLIDGQIRQMYSYSFLGLGQDEAVNVFGIPNDCAYGIGFEQDDWQVKNCYQSILLSQFRGTQDPYNFFKTTRGTHNQIPVYQSDITQWVLTGAFNYMKETDINNCCANQGVCYKKASSCFRPIYLHKYLESISVPIDSEKKQASWTLGAMLCAESQCLSQVKAPPICRWLSEGCL